MVKGQFHLYFAVPKDKAYEIKEGVCLIFPTLLALFPVSARVRFELKLFCCQSRCKSVTILQYVSLFHLILCRDECFACSSKHTEVVHELVPHSNVISKRHTQHIGHSVWPVRKYDSVSSSYNISLYWVLLTPFQGCVPLEGWLSNLAYALTLQWPGEKGEPSLSTPLLESLFSWIQHRQTGIRPKNATLAAT